MTRLRDDPDAAIGEVSGYIHRPRLGPAQGPGDLRGAGLGDRLATQREAAHEAGGDRQRTLALSRRESRGGQAASGAGELFGEYATRWIDERRNSKGEPLRVLTQKDYRQVLATYLDPTFGRRAIGRITGADVRTWHAGLTKGTPRARTKAYGLLCAIMNSAVDDELIAALPVHIRGAGAATTKRPVEPATPGEIELIGDNMPPRLRAAVWIAAWSALRYGELAELRRKDIDRTNHRIKVRRAVTFPPGAAVVGPPKSDASYRDVSIPPHV